MKCLRSLQIHDLSCVERLEGLEGLTNLTRFEWSYTFRHHSIFNLHGLSKHEVIVGRLPGSLKYLEIQGPRVLLGLDVLARCNNLCKLTLAFVEVGVQLDLRNCSLELVWLFGIFNLQTLLLPSTRMTSRLQSLNIDTCMQLVDIQGLDQLVCLDHFDLGFHALKKVLNLLSLTKLQTLIIRGGTDSIELHIPRQLQEFRHSFGGSTKAPNLSGFNQLQVLDLSWSHNLACMSEMGDLPALRSLDLSHCRHLRRLPDLSKSRNLEELDLNGCDTLELYEEDIQTLATLPSLHPVHFSSVYARERGRTKLDLGGRKLLQYVGTDYYPPKSSLNWMEGEWEEKELGQPPIKLGERVF